MRVRIQAALAAAAILAFAPSAFAQIDAGSNAAFQATTLSISAFGEVKTAPDKATITLGVQTTSPTAAQAMSANAARMSQVTAALRRQGVADKDIQTSNINLSAQYNYEQNKAPQLVGYQASNEVTITVQDLGRLGATIDAVTAAGANQINGVEFGLKDPQAAEDQARVKAVQALAAKAQLYAGASGYRIGRLVNLSEGGGAQAVPYAPKMVAMANLRGAAPTTPVEAGELTIRIDVSGLYELTK
jgi:uncharacterized protein YggE